MGKPAPHPTGDWAGPTSLPARPRPATPRLIALARYWVTCRAVLSGGTIAHLRDAGIYRSSTAADAGTRSAGGPRHYLSVEARDADDALLIARGALAVAGAEVSEIEVGNPPPDPSVLAN